MLLSNYLQNIAYLLEKKIAAPAIKDSDVLKASLMLLGDLAQALPANVRIHFHGMQWIRVLIAEGSTQGFAKEEIDWACKILQ